MALLEKDLAHVLERITDGFLAVDADWRVIYINGEARRLLRTRDADVDGLALFDVFPKARGTRFEREYRQAMEEQRAASFTEFSSTAQRWLEVRVYPSSNGLSIFLRDVTERMRAERELETQSQQLQALTAFGRIALGGESLAQLSHDAMEMLHVYLDVPIVEVHSFDRATQRFTLVGSDGWGDTANMRPEASADSQLGEALRGQPVVTNDVRMDARFCDRRGFASFGVRAGLVVLVGTPTEAFGALSAYTTAARTFTPNEVRFGETIAMILAEAIRRSEQHGRILHILESMTDGFIALDRSLRVTYMNRHMADVYGIDSACAVGCELREYLEREGTSAHLEHFERALREGRPVSFESFLERRNRWFEVRVFPQAEGLSTYVRDVTKRKLDERELHELNARLEQRVAERTQQLQLANKELESFAYSVSHDLRAPLRAIDGFSQALEEDYAGVLDARGTQYLDRVRRAAQRMANLIDALLHLARVARQPIVPVRVDLTAMAQTIVADLRAEATERQVAVHIGEGLFAFGESALVRAVLENLLSNAWKFTRRQTDARIVFDRDQSGELFVRDNGAGFDMRYASKLFGAFQRLHAVDEFEGTGIGLATVARIVHRHGGEIRAEGAVDRGATFWFTLPALEAAA